MNVKSHSTLCHLLAEEVCHAKREKMEEKNRVFSTKEGKLGQAETESTSTVRWYVYLSARRH
jgi:hypothetical protein